jgi:hypothetical protein
MLVNSDPRNGASNHKPDCMRRQTTARNNLLHGTAATHWPLHPPRRRGCLLFSCVSSRQRRASWAARRSSMGIPERAAAPIETLAVCPRRAVFPIRLRTLCTPHAHRAARYARHVPPCTYTERPPAGGWAAAVRVRPSNPSPGGPSLPAPLPKPQGEEERQDKCDRRSMRQTGRGGTARAPRQQPRRRR